MVVSRVVPRALGRKDRLRVDRNEGMIHLLPGTEPMQSVDSRRGPLRRAVISQAQGISQRMGLVGRMVQTPRGRPAKTATRLPSLTRILQLASPAAASRETKRTRSRRDNREMGISRVTMRPDPVPLAVHQLAVLPEGAVVAVMGATNRLTVRRTVTLPKNP